MFKVEQLLHGVSWREVVCGSGGGGVSQGAAGVLGWWGKVDLCFVVMVVVAGAGGGWGGFVVGGVGGCGCFGRSGVVWVRGGCSGWGAVRNRIDTMPSLRSG